MCCCTNNEMTTYYRGSVCVGADLGRAYCPDRSLCTTVGIASRGITYQLAPAPPFLLVPLPGVLRLPMFRVRKRDGPTEYPTACAFADAFLASSSPAEHRMKTISNCAVFEMSKPTSQQCTPSMTSQSAVECCSLLCDIYCWRPT